jgi:thiamine-monophosphate kinase
MEEQLINLISKSISSPEYLGDDCAVVELAGENYLFCVDNFVENTHFSEDYFSPADIGWKALAVNISDIAAMRGQPLFALVGLSLNDQIKDKEKWVTEFYQGMQSCADKFGAVKIIGGDLSSQKGFSSISVTVVGKAAKPVFRKTGSKDKLEVCVTGKFGNSKSFLDAINNEAKIFSEDKKYHLRPEPRLKEASNCGAFALMDASDGLAASLCTLAKENNACIEIESALIPRDEHVSLEQALYGGEDYELVGLFTKCPQDGKGIFKKIGVLTHEDKPQIVHDSSLNQDIDKTQQYQHF